MADGDRIAASVELRRSAARVVWTAVLAAGICAAGAVEAEDAPTVTLADALHQALRPDNPAVQQLDDNVAGAAGRLQAAQGAFDWRADVSGGWQQLYVAHLGPGGILTNQTDFVDSYYYTVDMAKRFRNGVEIAPGVTAFPGTAATPAQTAGATQIKPQLGLKLPILRGSGSSADAPERAAQAALQGARANRAFARQQYAQQVAATFWRCVATSQIFEETEEVRHHVTDYQQTLEKLRDKGIIEPTIVQEFAANNVKTKLAAGRAQDDAAHCRGELGYLMTGDVGQNGPAPAGDLPDVEALGGAIEKLKDQDLTQLALDRRQDLEAAARNLSAAHENVVSAKDNLRSELDLRIDPTRAFVTFSRPFGNNYGKGRTAEAHAQENSAALTVRQLQDQVRTQVDDTLTSLRRARADWTTLAAAEAQLTTVVADAEKRARLGVIGWRDYLAAQNELSDLHQQKINVRLAFAVNLSLLELAIGAIDPDRPTALAENLAKAPAP